MGSRIRGRANAVREVEGIFRIEEHLEPRGGGGGGVGRGVRPAHLPALIVGVEAEDDAGGPDRGAAQTARAQRLCGEAVERPRFWVHAKGKPIAWIGVRVVAQIVKETEREAGGVAELMLIGVEVNAALDEQHLNVLLRKEPLAALNEQPPRRLPRPSIARRENLGLRREDWEPSRGARRRGGRGRRVRGGLRGSALILLLRLPIAAVVLQRRLRRVVRLLSFGCHRGRLLTALPLPFLRAGARLERAR